MFIFVVFNVEKIVLVYLYGHAPVIGKYQLAAGSTAGNCEEGN
ncbi:MAG: hypothetical protein ABIW38_13540 [Ferruginibacter sp.]